MFKNYLTVAFRNLKRHKLYSTINILGLAVGMACCFLILLFVVDELSYDRQHPNADRLYRVINGGSAKTAPVLAPTMKDHLPGVAQVTRLMDLYRALIRYGDVHDYESRFYWADANVFEVFHLPLLQGDPKTALVEPNTMVLTEAMVKKYFGDTDPIGQIMTYGREAFRVTGILKDPQMKSHIRPDFLVSAVGRSGQVMTEWFFAVAYTYVVLQAGVDATDFQNILPDFANTYAKNGSHNFVIQSIQNIHLYSHLTNEAEANGDVRYLYIFGSISALILLIACINFVNLSTARSAYRAREVGARKVLGARRWQLVGQFLGESVVVSLIAFVLAISLFEMLLPVFNTLFDTSLSVGIFSREWMVCTGVGIALLVGVIAGSYSAFFLSSFSPIQAICGTLKTGLLNTVLRQGLVIFQFVVSTALMVCTAIVYFQLDYIQAKNLGFDKDQVLEIANTNVLNTSRFEAFRNVLLSYPNIQMVSTGELPGLKGSWNSYQHKGRHVVVCHQYKVDYHYLDVMGIQLISGRFFSPNHPTDKDALVVNQAYLDQMYQEKIENSNIFERSSGSIVSRRTEIGTYLFFIFRNGYFSGLFGFVRAGGVYSRATDKGDWDSESVRCVGERDCDVAVEGFCEAGADRKCDCMANCVLGNARLAGELCISDQSGLADFCSEWRIGTGGCSVNSGISGVESGSGKPGGCPAV